MMYFDWRISLKWNLWVLRLVGLWPNGHYQLDWYGCYAFLAVNLFITCNTLLQVVSMFSMDDLTDLATVALVVISEFLGIVKVYFFIRNLPGLQKMLHESILDSFQPGTEKQKRFLEENLKWWQYYRIMFLMIVISTLVMWTAFPLIEHKLPFVYPFDVDKSPMFEVVYVYQSVSVWFLAIASMHMDSLTAAFMVFIKSQCEILCDNLLSTPLENFNQLIRHHQKIIKFSFKLNHFFSMIILAQMFTSAIAIGSTMFRSSLVVPFSGEFYALTCYGLAMTIQILGYCWFGNEMTVKSEEIPMAAYHSNWTDSSIPLKKNLIFFIRRAQKPLRWNAMYLFDIDLNSFMAIIRSSYSYFALLHQVTDK